MRRFENILQFAATDLSSALGCGHLSELDHQVTLGSLKKPTYRDPVLDALMEQGRAHEGAYLKHLWDQGKAVMEVAVDGTPESAVEQTGRLMKEGAPVIYQACLADKSATWQGRADFLVRVETPSDLGAHSYRVLDTKLAAETRAGTILQLCLYSDLVQQVQGILPEFMSVVTPIEGFTEIPYRVDDFMAYYRLARRNLLGRLTETVSSYPEPVEQCDICRWWGRCSDRRRADDHLSLVAGISRSQRSELVDHQIPTLQALAEAPDPLAFKPKRGSRESLARAQKQAQLQLRGRLAKKHVYELIQPVEPERGFNLLPEPSEGDLFLDLEGDRFVGLAGLEYLFGWGYQTQGTWRYECVWSRTPVEEKQAFETFMALAMARLKANADMYIYHYAPYEPSAFKRLAARYGTCAEQLDELLRGERFVDLYRVARQSVVASVESYSIKDLEPIVGFSRQIELADVRRHKHAVEGCLQLGAGELPSASIDVVQKYNEDDCRAALALRDWLEVERAKLIADGESLARPAVKAGEPSEGMSEWLERIVALERALLNGLSEDPATREQEPDQQARWLLAHMLRWHRREENCVWWERFRLADLEGDDLKDEGKALAGLRYEREIDKQQYNPKLRSPIHRYLFDQQELEIRAGHDLLQIQVAEVFPAFGEVLGIDPSAGWVDVKTPRGFDPRSVESSTGVLKDELVSARPVAASIERVAKQAVSDGLDIGVSNPLVAKLLRRMPMAGLPVPLHEPWDIVDHLRGDVLPVQGPPGSGKSYAGARMILRLHQAGKKVGVTANSHPVIDNLLRAVADAAKEWGIEPPRMAHVGPDREGDDAVKMMKKERALAEFDDDEIDVLGGTVWLWSTEGRERMVDTLFIDEAGQMSLANAVAAAPAATNLVLLGDPQQLAQPTQASHPEGTEVSVLEHLIHGAATITEDKGLFLASTYRLHPDICRLTSELYYQDRLHSAPGLERQRIDGVVGMDGSGLRLEFVEHDGNTVRSLEEVAHIEQLTKRLLTGGQYTDQKGKQRRLSVADILIVAPYNAQVNALRDAMPNLRIGTVDKFQGQEAPVVIYGMTTSSPEDAPRGMEFVYDPHRFNVAISRARALAILVASPQLFNPTVRSPHQMRLANALARYAELATT